MKHFFCKTTLFIEIVNHVLKFIGMTGTKRRGTQGMTTTGTYRAEDLEYVQINGFDVHVKPKP